MHKKGPKYNVITPSKPRPLIINKNRKPTFSDSKDITDQITEVLNDVSDLPEKDKKSIESMNENKSFLSTLNDSCLVLTQNTSYFCNKSNSASKTEKSLGFSILPKNKCKKSNSEIEILNNAPVCIGEPIQVVHENNKTGEKKNKDENNKTGEKKNKDENNNTGEKKNKDENNKTGDKKNMHENKMYKNKKASCYKQKLVVKNKQNNTKTNKSVVDDTKSVKNAGNNTKSTKGKGDSIKVTTHDKSLQNNTQSNTTPKNITQSNTTQYKSNKRFVSTTELKILLISKLEKLNYKKRFYKQQYNKLKKDKIYLKQDLHKEKHLNNILLQKQEETRKQINQCIFEKDTIRNKFDDYKTDVSYFLEMCKLNFNTLTTSNNNLQKSNITYKEKIQAFSNITKLLLEDINNKIDDLSVSLLFRSYKNCLIERLKAEYMKINTEDIKNSITRIEETRLKMSDSKSKFKRLFLEQINLCINKLNELDPSPFQDIIKNKDLKIAVLKSRLKKYKRRLKSHKKPKEEQTSKSTLSESDVWKCFRSGE